MRELKKRRTKTKAVITLAIYIGFLFNARWQQGSSKRNLSLAPSAMQNNLLLCLFKVSEIVLAWIERHNRRVLDCFGLHLYIYFTTILLCTIASNMSTYSIERGLPLNDSLCWSCSLGYHFFFENTFPWFRIGPMWRTTTTTEFSQKTWFNTSPFGETLTTKSFA